MRKFFTAKASSRRSAQADISRSPGRTFTMFRRPYKVQQIFKDAYTAAVKRRKKGNKVVVNQESSSKLATVDGPMGQHSNSYPPNSTSTKQDVIKSDTRESSTDAGHLQPLEHAVDESVTKPEASDESRVTARSDARNNSKQLHQHEHISTPEEKRVTVMPLKHQMQRSENNTQPRLTPPDGYNIEKGQKGADGMGYHRPNDHNLEKERMDMKKLNRIAADLKAAQRHNQDLEERNRQLTVQLTALSTQLQGLETQHQRTLQLLEDKTSALKGAQAFLTKEDSLSGADVIAMVDTLNAEILQIAAFMADCLDGTERDLNADTEEAEAARESAFQSLGEPMVRILAAETDQPKSGDEFMGLQIALQICLVYSCNRIVESWIPGYWRQGMLLANLHSRITEKEGQSVSGRWRAITRTYVKHLIDLYPPMLAFVVAEVDTILAIAGWSQRLLEEKGFSDIFQEKLTRIVTLALRLQTAIGESVISGDMQTILISPDATFDRDIMEDGFSQNERTAEREVEERVAGTTDIGLQRSTKGSGIHLLRKPKVVLCSALD